MVRTQIHLTETQRAELAALAERRGKKQSELIREAINEYIARFSRARRQATLQEASGMWRDRGDLPDFASLRKEWGRGSTDG